MEEWEFTVHCCTFPPSLAPVVHVTSGYKYTNTQPLRGKLGGGKVRGGERCLFLFKFVFSGPGTHTLVCAFSFTPAEYCDRFHGRALRTRHEKVRAPHREVGEGERVFVCITQHSSRVCKQTLLVFALQDSLDAHRCGVTVCSLFV